MKRSATLLFVITIFFYGCGKSNAQLEMAPAFPNLSFEQPVDIQNAGDGSNRLFVVSQSGRIYVFQNDQNASSKKTFLDIRNKVLFGGEQGLLGLAFHPDYKSNGYFYVDYVTDNPKRTIISRFSISKTNPDSADENSELILLEVNQPYSNHNGGQIAFGPDGYLYISFGDGGSGGDPQNNAQNLEVLLGKILRIDVNNSSGSRNYSIPSDNPLVANLRGFRDEIWAYGLRNVWRFSFDKPTGRLWAADVGQNAWEEIDIIEKGKNYGWRTMEGFHCYNPSSSCDQTGLTLPIWEYAHDQNGGISITGGYVYRGKNAQEIYGKYIYSDYGSKRIWALDYDGSNASNELLFTSTHVVTTFGVDENDELYFSDYGNGKLYKFEGTLSTEVSENKLPDNFQLMQNYPNPFNPETVISYRIPAAGFVSLKVFDLLGREITSLVNEHISAGPHQIKFNSLQATGNKPLATGIYFYILTTGSSTQTKKMLLLK